MYFIFLSLSGLLIIMVNGESLLVCHTLGCFFLWIFHFQPILAHEYDRNIEIAQENTEQNYEVQEF